MRVAGGDLQMANQAAEPRLSARHEATAIKRVVKPIQSMRTTRLVVILSTNCIHMNVCVHAGVNLYNLTYVCAHTWECVRFSSV